MSSEQNSVISSRNSRSNLRGLLDNTLVHNKADINIYSYGHLNESNLYKRDATITEDNKKGYWPHSSAGGSILQPHKNPCLGPPTSTSASFDNQKPSRSTRHATLRHSAMRNTLREFTVDTPLKVPCPPSVPRENVSKHPVQSATKPDSASTSASNHGYMDDGVFIEKAPFFNRNSNTKFNTPYSSMAITKADQYNQLKRFDQTMLRNTFIENANPLTKPSRHCKRPIVDNLVDCERVVKMGLAALDHPENASFMRLQVYADGFECINNLSTTFGYLLSDIKSKYDNYVERLLDDNTSGGHRRLIQQMSDSMSGGAEEPITKMLSDIEESRHHLSELTDTAQQSLDHNKRLKGELSQERELEEELENEPKPRVISRVNFKTPSKPQTFSEKVEDLRVKILAIHKKTNDLKKELRNQFEPISVTGPLQRCVKDTEVQCQKLKFNHTCMKQECEDNNKVLSHILQSLDIPAVDSRNIWSVIEGDISICDLDIEKSEQEKWCWYIS